MQPPIGESLAGATGLEPAASAVTVRLNTVLKQRSLTSQVRTPTVRTDGHTPLYAGSIFGLLGQLNQNCLPVVLDRCVGLRGEVHAHSVPILDTHDAENSTPQHSWKNAYPSSNC